MLACRIMRSTRIWITFSCCFFALAAFLWAETRKPGLWELTTTQTWQQSPFPPGITPPGGANSPFAGGTHTSQVCLTQQQIDKYGAIVPQTRGGCQVTNIAKKGNSMTADMICTGMMSGKGIIEESSSSDGEHAKGKVHFTGSLQLGPNTKPIEWTIDSSSVFKGTDCGNVKPIAIPDK